MAWSRSCHADKNTLNHEFMGPGPTFPLHRVDVDMRSGHQLSLKEGGVQVTQHLVDRL